MSKKPQPTNHRTRLTRAAWAAKERIEAEGFRDPHTNRPLKGTQSIVEFALVQFEGSSKEAERYLAHNKTLIDEADVARAALDALQLRYDELFAQAEGHRTAAENSQLLANNRLEMLETAKAERDAARERGQSLSNAIWSHVRDCGGEENVPQVPPAEALQAVRENLECAVEQRAELDEKNDDLVAELKQVAEESAALRDRVKDLQIKLANARNALAGEKHLRDEARAEVVRARELIKDRQEACDAWVSTERDLRKRIDTLRVELEQAKQGDPRWIAAGFMGFAVGAAAMLLLRLWGV